MENNKKELIWLENASRWMDSKYRLPGTNIRFGLDPILGLVPFLGDITTLVISGGLVISMAKYGVSRKVVILMVLNVLLDAIVGSIPIIGNIFDFAYRANTRNVNLLKKHYEQGKYKGSGTGIILIIVLVLLLTLALLIYGLIKFTQYILDLVGFS